MAWRVLLLAVGVYACSTAVIMIKVCAVHPVLLASYRQLVAAAALSPLLLRDLRRLRRQAVSGAGPAFRPRMLLRTVLPGVVLGAHFISWIIGARRTSAANSSLIVNMVPVVMPFLLYALLRERLTRGELAGTAVVLAGVALLSAGDVHLRPDRVAGDVLCFGSMLLFALYLALGRRNRDFPSLWLYLVPLYFAGGAACFVAAVASGASPLAVPTAWDALMILGLGLVPTVLGHSILNASMKHLPGQTVSIANLGQFVFAGVMGWAWLHEAVDASFYPAAALVVIGSALAVRSAPRPMPVRPAGKPESAADNADDGGG